MKNFILLLIIAAIAHGDPVAAEAPQARNGDKLLIVNDDGFSKFYSGYYTTEADLRKEGLRYKDTQVAVLEWCITSGSRTNFPCKTSELIGAGLSEFGRRGDKVATETLRRLEKLSSTPAHTAGKVGLEIRAPLADADPWIQARTHRDIPPPAIRLALILPAPTGLRRIAGIVTTQWKKKGSSDESVGKKPK